LLAQICAEYGKFEEAEQHARKALKLFVDWGTAYDKRISWAGWVAWARVLLKQAREHSWPNTALGMLNLGMVDCEK